MSPGCAAGPLLEALVFAADRHRGQKRKGRDAIPYVNHLIAVASILANEGGVQDETLLVAAILHDTVEDTGTTLDELTQRFGAAVTALVREVTDDKSLPSPVRKRLQIEHASASSRPARELKLADKIANLRDLVRFPPRDWDRRRLSEYVTWAGQVGAGCRGVNRRLEEVFDQAIAEARAAYPGE